MAMSRAEAITFAKEMRKNSGASYQEIGRQLAERGFVSAKTGKPLTQGGIDSLINYVPVHKVRAQATRRKKRKARAQPYQPRKTGGNARIQAAYSILQIKAMDPHERIAAACLILEGHA